MPGKQRKVDEGDDIVHGVVMLRDTQSPADLGARSAAVGMGHSADGFSGHARLTLGSLEGVFLNVGLVGFESASGVLDELFVSQPGDDDFAAHRVGQRNIGTHVQAQPEIGPLRGTGAPRIHDIEFSAVANAFQQMMKKDRVRFPGVRSPQQDHVSAFNFAIRACPATCSEYRRQTGDARGVSSPVAAIDIVRAHHAADEFLRRVVQFVSGLGATEHAKVPRIVFLDGFAERCSDAVHGFIPRSGTMRTVLAHQWLGQTGLHWSQHNIPKVDVRRIVAPFDLGPSCRLVSDDGLIGISVFLGTDFGGRKQLA